MSTTVGRRLARAWLDIDHGVAIQVISMNLPLILPENRGIFHSGRWHSPKGGYSTALNPSTGATLGRVSRASAADVDEVVRGAHSGFMEWRRTSPLVRATALRRIANVVRAHADELGMIDAANCGNALAHMRKDPLWAANQIDLFAGLITEIKGSTFTSGADNQVLTVREPVGVCARIMAFNHPAMFVASKIAAPLAAGNSVIVKPAPQTPLSAYRLIELIGDELPPGVLNVVSGDRECGEALVAHPLVRVVTLIGSIPTGRLILRGAAEGFKRVLLELGGKNALVVCPDANVEKAIQGAVAGMNFGPCAGQSCGSTSRVFAHESVYHQVVEGVVSQSAAYVPGIATEMTTKMGAVISTDHQRQILNFIASAEKQGARVVLGGRAPSNSDLAAGSFVEPTVLADVSACMRVAREEIFGPVVSVIRWSDEASMIQQVNELEYGLTAAIYAESLRPAHQLASRLEVGTVAINSIAFHQYGAPFGGMKLSGIGREESIDELFEFTQLKTMTIDFRD